jgi:hypothetical protein
VKVCTNMDRFISIVDLVPIIMEEKAYIQFLFNEGLLNTRMLFFKFVFTCQFDF